MADELKFLHYRKPTLEAGTYTFTATPSYGNPSGDASADTANAVTVNICVAGARVQVSPDKIFARYPNPGEKGDFADTIPHISLNQPTLPWERSAYATDSQGDENYEPWVYLMVITEADIANGRATQVQSVSFDDLSTSDNSYYMPAEYYSALSDDFTIDDKKDNMKVIDVKKSFFDMLIGNQPEHIEYLSHVRQRYSDEGELIREIAVIMANRFAQADTDNYPDGMTNYAVLVSLEGYFDDDDLPNVADDTYIRLVVLTDWSFIATEATVSFEQRVTNLDVDSLRLPSESGITDAFDDRLSAGLTAIAHQFRLGDTSLSWYHGPCIPYDNGDDNLSDSERGYDGSEYTATDADKFLRFYQNESMFDISYAAAYELGRLLSMRNPDYTQTLNQYKRKKARYITLLDDDETRREAVSKKGITIDQLPYTKLSDDWEDDYIPTIESWLTSLATLEYIPSWYILPDPNLLSSESLRTFYIDKKWIKSLWLGALSIGGRAEVTYNLFGDMLSSLTSSIPYTGFLLRSDVVWAYPELSIAVTSSSSSQSVLKEEQLRDDIKLCLVDGDIDYVSLSLPPEALHYGCDKNDATYTKSIEYNNTTVASVTIPFLDETYGIIDIETLATDIATALANNSVTISNFGSAHLGRYMLEGEPKAEFTQSTTPSS